VGQTYYAVDAVCPVDGTNLAREGRLVGDLLICPHDDARFDIRTGRRVDGAGELGARSIRVEGNRGQSARRGTTAERSARLRLPIGVAERFSSSAARSSNSVSNRPAASSASRNG
jgi:hypothetical protein